MGSEEKFSIVSFLNKHFPEPNVKQTPSKNKKASTIRSDEKASSAQSKLEKLKEEQLKILNSINQKKGLSGETPKNANGSLKKK